MIKTDDIKVVYTTNDGQNFDYLEDAKDHVLKKKFSELKSVHIINDNKYEYTVDELFEDPDEAYNNAYTIIVDDNEGLGVLIEFAKMNGLHLLYTDIKTPGTYTYYDALECFVKE